MVGSISYLSWSIESLWIVLLKNILLFFFPQVDVTAAVVVQQSVEVVTVYRLVDDVVLRGVVK